MSEEEKQKLLNSLMSFLGHLERTSGAGAVKRPSTNETIVFITFRAGGMGHAVAALKILHDWQAYVEENGLIQYAMDFLHKQKAADDAWVNELNAKIQRRLQELKNNNETDTNETDI